MNIKQVLLSFELLLMVGFFSVHGFVIQGGNQDNQGNGLMATSGNIKIRIENGTIFCDTLTCPPESFKCSVIKNTTRDNVNQTEVTRECLDTAGKSTAKTVEYEPNAAPGAHGVSYITADKNGGVSAVENSGNSNNQSSDSDWQRKLKERMDEMRKRLNNIHKQPPGSAKATGFQYDAYDD